MTATARTEAHAILTALATAFGGHSQVPDAVVGAAIFGRANNAPTAWPVESAAALVDDCAAAIDARWDGGEGTRERIAEGYRAARGSCSSSHAPAI